MCERAKWDLIFFLNKRSHLFVCFFGGGASVVIIRQLCFLSTMWVLVINLGHQAWPNMALHAKPS